MPNQDKWDRHFINLCLQYAKMSKDPSTQVGSVIVGDNNMIISAGFNGLPRGIADTPERLNDRDTKIKLVVHAEVNAILNAAKHGVQLNNGTLYVAATDKSGEIWGGAPCIRCTVELLQTDIYQVVSLPIKTAPSRWHADLLTARGLLEEAGVVFREVSL